MELDFLFRKRMEEAGRMQSYCIKELFTSMNALSDKYIYEVFTTKTNTDRLYDAILCLRDKCTENVIEWFICKVYIEPDHLDEYLLPKSDYNKLKRAKYQYTNDSFSQVYKELVIYFTTENTVIFNLHNLKEEPYKQKYKDGNRLCYNLNIDDGSKKSFIYNIDNHHTDLIIERDIIEDEILDLYKYQDAIKEEIERKHKLERSKLPKV